MRFKTVHCLSLSFFSRGEQTREISWLTKAREKKIFFSWRIFSTLMLVDSKKERKWLHLPSLVAAREIDDSSICLVSFWRSSSQIGWHRRQQRCQRMAFFLPLRSKQRHGLSVYVETLGASILDSSSSCRHPLRNSSSVRLPSLFSSILEYKKKEITALKKKTVLPTLGRLFARPGRRKNRPFCGGKVRHIGVDRWFLMVRNVIQDWGSWNNS